MSIDSDEKRSSSDSSSDTGESTPVSLPEQNGFDQTSSAAPVPTDSHAKYKKGSSAESVALNIDRSIRAGLPQRLGDFELIKEIGRGGMGVVYEARQQSLNKRVAVKILPFSGVLNERAIKRFQNEAWAAAQLQHRNIIPVYHVGSERGVYFYAMQYVNGGDLGDLFNALRDAAIRGKLSSTGRGEGPTPPPLEEFGSKLRPSATSLAIAEPTVKSVDGTVDAPNLKRDSTHRSGWSKGDTLASRHLMDLIAKNHSTSIPQFLKAFISMGIQVADALHYAHEMGIVHRDIKPSNLLLDVEGDVWVADFGLAQVQSDPGMTATGAIVGTVPYMSPEQVLGKRVGIDHRTDIYSLGVTLYELLTLTRAFRGENREAIIRKVTFDDPTLPRKIDRRIPAELETIVMKAMSKNPSDRYQTAAEMADDFRLFRDDQPIKGRNPSIPQRLDRWARRHRPLVASAGAITLITFAAAIAVAVISWNYYTATAATLESEREQSAEIERLLDRSEGLRLVANSALELEADPARALLLAISGAERYPGIDANDAVLQALDANHEFRTLTGHPGPVGHLAFNADGTKLLSSATRARFQQGPDAAMIWDTATGQLLGQLKHETTITSAVFSPDAFRVLTASSPPAKLAIDDIDGKRVSQPPMTWDLTTLNKLVTFENAFLFEAHAAAFSPDGLRVVFPSMGNAATIYDCVAGHPIVRLQGHDKRVVFAAFSPQGDRIVTASDDNTVRIWNATSGMQVFQFDIWQKLDPTIDQCVIDSVEFRADGRQLVTGSNSYGVHLWDLSTGTRINEEHLPGSVATYWPDGLRFLTYRPRGREMTTRDSSEGKTLRTIRPENGMVRRAMISPNGQWIATHELNVNLVSVRNAARGELKAVLQGHQFLIQDMAFSPDSQMMATASSDKTVRLWHIASGSERATFPTRSSPIHPLSAASPDGKQFAIATEDSVMTGKMLDFKPGESVIDISSRIWMPPLASNRFVTSRDDRLAVHSVADGKELAAINRAVGRYQLAAVNLDGDRVAAFSGGEAITLWFPDDNRRLSLLVGPTQVFDLTFNPSGDRLVSVSADGFARVWDADTGQLLASLQNDGQVFDAVFSPDAKQIATVTDQNRAIIWDFESFDKRTTLQAPDAKIHHVAFSFDGTQLVSHVVHDSDAVHLWDALTGELKSRLDVSGQVHVAMHPSRNEALVTSTKDGAVIWQFDQNLRQPISDDPMVHGEYSADGSQLVIGSAVPRVDPMSPPEPNPEIFGPARLERWTRDDLLRQDSMEFPSGSIYEFFLSRDGRAFVNMDNRFGLVNHDIETHKSTAFIPGHAAPISACRFTADSKRLITCSWDQTISIWSIPDGQRLLTLSGHESAVHCAALSSDDRLLVTGADDGQCILWNLQSGQIDQRLRLAQKPIRHVAFNPAGNQILAVTSDHSIHLYDLQANQDVDLNVGTESVAWAEYAPDGSSLLVIPQLAEKPDGGDNPQPNGDASPVHPVLIVPLNGNAITAIPHDGPVLTAHFHPNGEQIITATQNGSATLRNIKSGQVIQEFTRPGVDVRAAVLSDAGEFVAVAGAVQTTIWKVKEGVEWFSVPSVGMIPTPMHRYDPFVPNSQRLITQQMDTFDFRDWPIEPPEFAKTLAPRPLSAEEKTRFLIDQLTVKDEQPTEK